MGVACDRVHSEDMETQLWRAYARWEWILAS